jgi:hypothetical protein
VGFGLGPRKKQIPLPSILLRVSSTACGRCLHWCDCGTAQGIWERRQQVAAATANTGILHCVQDDDKNKQVQRQPQVQDNSRFVPLRFCSGWGTTSSTACGRYCIGVTAEQHKGSGRGDSTWQLQRQIQGSFTAFRMTTRTNKCKDNSRFLPPSTLLRVRDNDGAVRVRLTRMI